MSIFDGFGIFDGEAWGDDSDIVDLQGDGLIGNLLGTFSEFVDDSWILENSAYWSWAVPGGMILSGAITGTDFALDQFGFDEGTLISDEISDSIGETWDNAVISLAGGLLGYGDVSIEDYDYDTDYLTYASDVWSSDESLSVDDLNIDSLFSYFDADEYLSVDQYLEDDFDISDFEIDSVDSFDLGTFLAMTTGE
jgi:hypothetical protein